MIFGLLLSGIKDILIFKENFPSIRHEAKRIYSKIFNEKKTAAERVRKRTKIMHRE